jgi:hypothetical protein
MDGTPDWHGCCQDLAPLSGQAEKPAAAVRRVRLDRHEAEAFEWLQRRGKGRPVHRQQLGGRSG